MRSMPPLVTESGSGKTFPSIGFIYRLIKSGGARRVLRDVKAEVDANFQPTQALR